jgi:hypothetical protein
MPRSPVPTPAPRRASARGLATKRRIDEEHRKLTALLGQLALGRDLEKTDHRLGELRALLVAHFETEEGPRGLHELVSEGASHRLPNVQHLFEEHRAILTRVDRLRATLRDLLDGPVAAVMSDVAQVAATLRRHEADEEALFSEVFYLDLGVKG